MIKKIFVGVLLAGIFGLLILGAVNRTLAKSDNYEPLALSEGSGRGNGTESGYRSGDQVNQSGNSPQLGRNNASTELGYKNQDSANESGLGTGKNAGGSGLGQSGQGGQGGSALGDGLGVGEANVETWEDPITVTVIEVSSDMWVVSNAEGFSMEIEGRTLSYMVENSFEVEIGDELVLGGFYEGEDFEIGSITNNTTLQTLAIREATGRPLWAGGGRNISTP